MCVMMVVSGFLCQYFHFGEPDPDPSDPMKTVLVKYWMEMLGLPLKPETNRLLFPVWDVRFGRGADVQSA